MNGLDANKLSIRNREHISKSTECKCYFCLATFLPSAIKEWCDDNDTTAICPKCRVDSVIGSASGVPMTEEFFKAMQERWFSSLMKKKKTP